jgi:hypothetical protein
MKHPDRYTRGVLYCHVATEREPFLIKVGFTSQRDPEKRHKMQRRKYKNDDGRIFETIDEMIPCQMGHEIDIHHHSPTLNRFRFPHDNGKVKHEEQYYFTREFINAFSLVLEGMC